MLTLRNSKVQIAVVATALAATFLLYRYSRKRYAVKPHVLQSTTTTATSPPEIEVIDKIVDKDDFESGDIIKIVLFCEECEPHLTKSNQKEYFARLEKQYKHIQRAIQLSANIGTSEFISYGLRIIGAIFRFWFVTGRQKEGASIAKQYSAHVNTECSSINAKYYQALGSLSHAQGQFEEAEEHFAVSLSFHTTLGNDHACAVVVNQLGICARERGEAISLHNSALEIFSKLGDQWGVALAQNNLGVVYREKGEWQKSKSTFEESLKIREEIGDQIGIASALGNMGAIAYALGEYNRAFELHDKCLKIRIDLNDHWGVCGAVTNLGLVEIERGQTGSAEMYLIQAIRSFSTLHDRLGICEALEALACLSARCKLWSKSCILFGAAKEFRRVIHAHVPLSRAGHYEKYKKEIEKHISASQIQKLQQDATQMDLQALIAYATNPTQ